MLNIRNTSGHGCDPCPKSILTRVLNRESTLNSEEQCFMETRHVHPSDHLSIFCSAYPTQGQWEPAVYPRELEAEGVSHTHSRLQPGQFSNANQTTGVHGENL